MTTGMGMGTSPGKSFPPRNPGFAGITLPLNNSVSQLATLSHSNHTLSPYARGHEHIAVRSFPHLGKTPSLGGQSRASSGDGGAQRGNVKAKRKRIYRLNTTKKEEEEEVLSPDLDDTPPSDDHEVYEAEDQFGRMSFNPNQYGYGGGHGHGHGHGQRDVPGSLTGIAQRVMRPNMSRSPASRTSYGFPDVE
jgi:distribution and morphology protein 34